MALGSSEQVSRFTHAGTAPGPDVSLRQTSAQTTKDTHTHPLARTHVATDMDSHTRDLLANIYVCVCVCYNVWMFGHVFI